MVYSAATCRTLLQRVVLCRATWCTLLPRVALGCNAGRSARKVLVGVHGRPCRADTCHPASTDSLAAALPSAPPRTAHRPACDRQAKLAKSRNDQLRLVEKVGARSPTLGAARPTGPRRSVGAGAAPRMLATPPPTGCPEGLGDLGAGTRTRGLARHNACLRLYAARRFRLAQPVRKRSLIGGAGRRRAESAWDRRTGARSFVRSAGAAEREARGAHRREGAGLAHMDSR